MLSGNGPRLTTTLWFVDDVFTVSHKWMKEFRDEIVKRKISMPFECITRADRLNDETMLLLKESGCFRVWIGGKNHQNDEC